MKTNVVTTAVLALGLIAFSAPMTAGSAVADNAPIRCKCWYKRWACGPVTEGEKTVIKAYVTSDQTEAGGNNKNGQTTNGNNGETTCTAVGETLGGKMLTGKCKTDHKYTDIVCKDPEKTPVLPPPLPPEFEGISEVLDF